MKLKVDYRRLYANKIVIVTLLAKKKKTLRTLITLLML